MKRLLEAAAANVRRCTTNTLEILVEDYCRLHGIEDQEDTRRLDAPTVMEKK
jgi:hypothetical protein